jgi:hypothetical protein
MLSNPCQGSWRNCRGDEATALTSLHLTKCTTTDASTSYNSRTRNFFVKQKLSCSLPQDRLRSTPRPAWVGKLKDTSIAVRPSISMPGRAPDLHLLASPYSYFALVYLRRNRELLKQYGVEVEYVCRCSLHIKLRFRSPRSHKTILKLSLSEAARNHNCNHRSSISPLLSRLHAKCHPTPSPSVNSTHPN